MNQLDHATSFNRRVGQFFGYLTLLLTFAMLFFFLILPVVTIVKKAFVVDGEFTFAYFGLLFANDLQSTAIINSILIGLATTFVATVLCIPLALINARYDFRGKALLSGLLLVPMIMPPFVGAIGIQRFFAKHGSINLWLLEMGLIERPIQWITQDSMFWVVVVLEVLHLYPIMYLNLSAAFANVDPSLEEMATTLGVSKFKQYKDIIFPLSRPGYIAGAIIVFIWALTDLGTPLLVGYHDTMPVRIFNMITDVNDNPVGFALVVVVVLITTVFFLLSRLATSGKKYQMMARGHVTSSIKPASFGVSVAIYGMVGFTIIAALIPHITVLVTSLSDKWFMTPLPEQWTIAHYMQAFQQDLSYLGIKNSFLFASMSTVVDLILGIMIAYVISRKLIPFGAVLDAIVMMPLALPGIVLAFGYVVTYSNTLLDPLHNPIPLLVIAYGIRRLPYMVRSAAAGLEQTSVSLEEASTIFGASRFHTLRKITIPLVSANLIAGSMLCFAYAMLDVSDSLILAMKDKYYPLTKAIYVLFLEQGNGEFVACALGVIAMIIMSACILGASLILGKKMGELFRS